MRSLTLSTDTRTGLALSVRIVFTLNSLGFSSGARLKRAVSGDRQHIFVQGDSLFSNVLVSKVSAKSANYFANEVNRL